MNIEKIRITRNAYCYPDVHMKRPVDYDIDTPRCRRGSKRRRQPPDRNRLNIEVAFLPHPNPGHRAGVAKRGPNTTWQFFDGICIGAEWG